MKIKNLISIIVLALIILTITACDNNSKYENDLERIKAEGKIVLGTSADYPPYEFHKEINGQDTIIGFDIEIAKEIASDLGVELVIKDMSFSGLLAALDSGNVDFVLACMTPTPERSHVDFSKIYYTAVQAIVVRDSEKSTLTSLEDLKGKVIGVQKGSIQQEIASKMDGVTVKAIGKISDLMLELKNNKIDAIIVEHPVASAYVSKNNDLALSSINLDSVDGGSAVALKKGSKELVEVINQTIDRLIENNLIEEYVIKATQLVESD